jgi:hypothetical protein
MRTLVGDTKASSACCYDWSRTTIAAPAMTIAAKTEVRNTRMLTSQFA